MHKIGAGKACITPEKPLPMAGYAESKRMARGVLDDLYTRAFYVEAPREGRLLIVSLDLIRVDEELYESIVFMLAEKYGFREEEVNIVATHNHAGPEVSTDLWSTWVLSPEEKRSIEEYKASLPNRVECAVKKALGSKEEAKLYIGSVNIPPGIVCNRISPSERVDETATFLIARNSEGDAIGLLLNFACHPTVLGPKNYMYSGDLAGKTCEVLEKMLNCTCIFLNGASGNVSTRFTRRNQSYSEMLNFANRIASSVFKASKSPLSEISSSQIRNTVYLVEMKTKPPPKLEDLYKLEKELKDLLQEFLKKGDLAMIEKIKNDLAGIKVLLEKRSFLIENNMVKMRIKTSRFEKDLLMLFFPGEAFNEYQLVVKEHSSAKYTMFIGYANGYVGYVPFKSTAFRQPLAYEEIISLIDPGELENMEKFLKVIVVDK